MENLKIWELRKMLDDKFYEDFSKHEDVTLINRWKNPDLNRIRKLNRADIRKILGDKRFEMSGYESDTGDCTVHNQKVLNVFAKFGIYDYTEYLFLDFYKGCPILYYRYWREKEHVVVNEWYGWTTSEIILEILNLTVYSGRQTRRRS